MRVVVRFTPEEAAQLRELADARGVTVQRLLSDAVLRNDITASRVVAQEVAAVRRLAYEDSVNLAKLANSGKWDGIEMDKLRKGIELRNQALAKCPGMGK